MFEHLTSALVAYGVWGILLLAFIDSAGVPVSVGMDALVVVIAAKAPSQAYLGATLAVLGSLAGNLTLFLAAYKGGGKFASKREPDAESPRFQQWFRRYGLATVFIPALVPILPLPLKVFVISAGVLRTPLRSFLLVILAARVLRYFGEAWLGIQFGQDSTRLLREQVWLLSGMAVALVLITFVFLRFYERRRARMQAGETNPEG